MLKKIAGSFIFVSFILSLIAYFIDESIMIYSSIFIWLAFFCLFAYIKNRKLIYTLLFFSLCIFIYLILNSYEVDYVKLLSINQYLISLLIGVSFLRLISNPKKDKTSYSSKGKKAFFRTYLGVHLFGSVINLSSLLLVADKFYKKAPLSKAQLVLLTRSFSSDAYWSPFFVAFAAALTYAPNLNSSIILVNGLFLAFIAFLITYFEVIKDKSFDLENFNGYPLNFSSLFLPFILAFFVLITSYFNNEIKIIVLISLYSLVLTFTILVLKKGLLKTLNKYDLFITDELPKMKVELGLFLVAGVFGVLMASLMKSFSFSMPFNDFTWIEASVLLIIFLVLAFIGIHPIITVAIIAQFMENSNHTLLAITFLMAWSTTVSTSPFSGLNLTLSSRYKVNVIDIIKYNKSYVLKMYIFSILSLYLISKYLNL